MTFLVALLVWVGTAILSWAYGRFIAKKPKLEPQPWQLSPVASGTPIPVLLGTARCRPIPVCFVSDELHDIIGGGSFVTGAQVVGQNHYVTYQGLICWGHLSGYQNLIINDSKLISRLAGDLREATGVTVDGRVLYSTVRVLTTDHDTGGFYMYVYGRSKIKFSIYLPDIFQRFDGIGGDFYLYYGTGQTGPDPILEAAKGVGNVPDYRELVYVVFDKFRMGMDPSRPIDLVLTRGGWADGLSGFTVGRTLDGPDTLAGLGGAQPWSVVDVSVPAALYALFADRQWALGIDPSEIDLGQWQGIEGLTNGGQYATETTGVSIYLTSQEQASAFKDECLRVLNAALVKHPETNQYQLKLIRNETPNQAAIDALRSFDEDDIRSCKVTVRTWPETYNEAVVEFTNPALLFETDVVIARNDASIAATGGKRTLKLSFPSVTDPELAQRIAIRELRAASPTLEKQTLRMTRAAWDLDRGDVFKVTYGPIGYSDRILRCLSVDLGTTRNSDVTVEAIDDVFAHEGDFPVTIETRDPGPIETLHPRAPVITEQEFIGPTSATLRLIIVDPDERLVSVEFASTVGDGTAIPINPGYTTDPDEPYEITVDRDSTESVYVFWRVSYLDEQGNTVSVENVHLFTGSGIAPAGGTLDGTVNPIIWDTEAKAVDAKSVIIDGDRSLLVLNAIVGFTGTLVVTSTNGVGNTLTLPPGSIYGDGSSLDVTLSLKDQLTVYYDGTYFWWDLVSSASTLPPIPLQAALVASANMTGSLSRLKAALLAHSSISAQLVGTVVNGLVGQWQSDAGVTTSGSEVTDIADQSTAGNDVTKIDTNGPTLVANVINGLPAIRNTASVTRLSHALTQLNSKSEYTLFLVRSPYDQTGQSTGCLVMGIEDGIGPQLSLGQSTAGDYRVGGFWSGAFRDTAAVYRGHPTGNLFDIVAVVRSSTATTYHKNGAALSPTFGPNGTAMTSPSVYLGGDRAGNAARGMWAQARVYDHALDASEMAIVFADLGAKYNIPLVATSGTALNRSGWTVSAWSTCGGGFAETSAVDNNTSTRYGSCANTTAGVSWFKIDLGSAQTVGGVQIWNISWSTDVPSSYDVQYSDDNSTWTTIASGTTSNGSTIVSSWTPASHRYWRILAQSGTQSGGWWSIGEINLYSDAAP